ncbi:MAG TPA: tetratricopeptide repeat protein [Thermoanaerobaculia bacterium]|nr:tetratricopeptide repeat protein [Thermoanaerobaculia bacterium]
MLCPRCGSDTAAPGGRCAVCNSPLDKDVATALLTPRPKAAPGPEDLTRGLSPAPASDSDLTEIGTPPPPSETGGGGPLQVGQNFGSRYQVIKLLGAGGMGAVYHAWDQELAVAVALKVIRPDAVLQPEAAAEMQRRFKRELLLARQVTHKNVVRIHDLGEIEGIKYITMTFIPGSDLSEILRKEGKIPIARALKITRQVAAGLGAAHEVGVVHRDLKPSNIMIDPEGNAIIMDFGIARSVGAGGSTVAGTVVGTLAYMAPEQAKGVDVDQRADIYALGLILYDMLLGRRHTAGSTSDLAELLTRIQQSVPPLRSIDPSIPEPVEAVVARCLETDREKRYATIAELVADLDLLDADGNRVRPMTPKESRESRRLQRTTAFSGGVSGPNPLRWIGAALTVAALGAGAFLLLGRRGPSRAAPAPLGGPKAVSLAILPFRNASGDSSLDWLGPSLSEMLRTDIGQATSLQTVPSDRLAQILRDLRISSDSTFDPSTLKKLADFSSADTVLWGQYLKFGSEIRIDATLLDVQRQRSVPLKAQAPSQDSLLKAVDELSQAIRQGLALSSDVIEELKSTAFKPSTRSLEALRSYNEGLQLSRQGKASDAVKKFQASVQSDPEFALAYSKLGQTYGALGYDTEAEQNSRKAVELSERLPAQEKYRIAATHARIVNDTAKAVEAYVNLAKVSPDDPEVNFELASLYESSGSFDQARDRYKKVVARDPKSVAALLASGRVEIKSGNPQASLEPLNKALSLAIQLENDEQKADVLHAIGAAYKLTEKPNDALRYYQESLAIKRRVGQKRGIAVTLGEIAQVNKQLGNPDVALASLTEALQIQREIGDKKGMAQTLIVLGGFYRDRGDYEQALKDYKESLQIQREVGNPNGEALCLNNIGNVYLFKAQYDDAQTYFERALEIREKIKNPRDIADTLHNLAETETNKGQYDNALKHYLRALEIRREAGDKRGAAIESHDMGTVFEYQGKYAAAVNAKEEALKIFQELKDRGFWMGEILSGTGHALALSGRFDAAEKPLAEAMTIAGELQNKALAAQILNFQGDRFLYRGDARAARPLYEQALQTASKTSNRRFDLQSRANLAKTAIAEGQSQHALESLKKIMGESDVIGLKYLSVDSSVSLGEAMIAARRYAAASQELERALARSDKLGLRALQARAHYLLAMCLRSTGAAAEALRHQAEARRLLEDIRKESKSDDVLKRSDLAPILSDTR